METMQLHEMLTVRIRIDTSQSSCRPLRGQRSSSEILGGEFYGERLQGQVIPGGSLFIVFQEDDLARMSVYYTLLTRDGIRIEVVGEGLIAFDDPELKHGELPVACSSYRCTCSTQFSVPAGIHEHLQRKLFVSKVNARPEQRSLTMSVFEVGET